MDFTQLNTKFQAELDQRIDRTTYQKVEDFLATPEYLLYCESIQSASMAMTQDLAKLAQHKTIVFPSAGIGTGLAEMEKRSPVIWNMMCDVLLNHFGFDNKLGKTA